MPEFKIPTDEDISTMMGGIPVLSYRPEDFPHFEALANKSCSLDQMKERVDAIRQCWLNAFPEIADTVSGMNEMEKSIIKHAKTLSALVTPLRLAGSEDVSFFVLLRRSKYIFPAEHLANITGLPRDCVRSDVTAQEAELISTYHEMAHMYFDLEGVFFDYPYDEELYCDLMALENYLYDGGRLEVVEQYIQGRALGGFLRLSSEYWLAPALSQKYIEGKDEGYVPYLTVWVSSSELRFRVADIVEGDGVLTSYDSEAVQDAFWAWDNGRIRDVQDFDLREAVLHLKDEVYCLYHTPKETFEALGVVLSNPNLNEFTKKCGAQILDAARNLTIGLVPDVVSEFCVEDEMDFVGALPQEDPLDRELRELFAKVNAMESERSGLSGVFERAKQKIFGLFSRARKPLDGVAPELIDDEPDMHDDNRLG